MFLFREWGMGHRYQKCPLRTGLCLERLFQGKKTLALRSKEVDEKQCLRSYPALVAKISGRIKF